MPRSTAFRASGPLSRAPQARSRRAFPRSPSRIRLGSLAAYAQGLRHDTGLPDQRRDREPRLGRPHLDGRRERRQRPRTSFTITVPPLSMKQQVVPNGNYGDLVLGFQTNDTGLLVERLRRGRGQRLRRQLVLPRLAARFLRAGASSERGHVDCSAGSAGRDVLMGRCRRPVNPTEVSMRRVICRSRSVGSSLHRPGGGPDQRSTREDRHDLRPPGRQRQVGSRGPARAAGPDGLEAEG